MNINIDFPFGKALVTGGAGFIKRKINVNIHYVIKLL